MIAPKLKELCASLQPWQYPASQSFHEELFSLRLCPHHSQPHFRLASSSKSSGSSICLIRWGRMWSPTLLILTCVTFKCESKSQLPYLWKGDRKGVPFHTEQVSMCCSQCKTQTHLLVLCGGGEKIKNRMKGRGIRSCSFQQGRKGDI